jgi:hypothetical protein
MRKREDGKTGGRHRKGGIEGGEGEGEERSMVETKEMKGKKTGGRS